MGRRAGGQVREETGPMPLRTLQTTARSLENKKKHPLPPTKKINTQNRTSLLLESHVFICITGL